MPTSRWLGPAEPDPMAPTAAEGTAGDISYGWRAPLPDREIVALHDIAFGEDSGGDPTWWRRQRPLSLGWVTATCDGTLIGFANVAWDGHRHAFLLDVAVDPGRRREGIGTQLVQRATAGAAAAGCAWLHVAVPAGRVRADRSGSPCLTTIKEQT